MDREALRDLEAEAAEGVESDARPDGPRLRMLQREAAEGVELFEDPLGALLDEEEMEEAEGGEFFPGLTEHRRKGPSEASS
jgi:hypothetical protein